MTNEFMITWHCDSSETKPWILKVVHLLSEPELGKLSIEVWKTQLSFIYGDFLTNTEKIFFRQKLRTQIFYLFALNEYADLLNLEHLLIAEHFMDLSGFDAKGGN